MLHYKRFMRTGDPLKVREGGRFKKGVYDEHRHRWDTKRHGLTATRTYVTWKAMKTRCNNPKAANYPRYGGQGIVVCERWNDFTNFYADMGERPVDTSLDRIDSTGNYEPGNCRWASPHEQIMNRRPYVTKKMRGL